MVRLCFIIIVFISGCTSDEDRFQRKLKVAINNNGHELNMREVAEFEWEIFLIVKPYTNLTNAQSEISVDLSKLKGASIEMTDGICALCFVKNEKVFEFIEISNYPYDFSKLENLKLYSASKARFIITEKEGKYIFTETYIPPQR